MAASRAFPDNVDTVMRGLVWRIHVFPTASKAWMAATSAAMTTPRVNVIGKCSNISRRAGSRVLALVSLVMGLFVVTAASAQTLNKVRARGSVNCGVNSGLIGFAVRDAQGTWNGFDVDLCRALA